MAHVPWLVVFAVSFVLTHLPPMLDSSDTRILLFVGVIAPKRVTRVATALGVLAVCLIESVIRAACVACVACVAGAERSAKDAIRRMAAGSLNRITLGVCHWHLRKHAGAKAGDIVNFQSVDFSPRREGEGL